MSDDTTCPIWGTSATVCPIFDKDGQKLDSARAGGKYLVTGTTESQLEDYDEKLKVRLTTWLIEQRRLGNYCPEISTKTLNEVRYAKDKPVHSRADGILRYLAEKTNLLGETIIFRFKCPQDSSVEESDRNYWSLLAHSESIDKKDLVFLLKSLEERGLLKYREDGPTYFKSCILTIKAYSKLDKLDAVRQPSLKAFVAMWFDSSMEDAWENGISPAIKTLGYEPVRIDKKEHANKIDDEIIAEIRRSRFIVADFTHGDPGVRGGVYYEAGFAHGLGIPVIFTCREDVLKNIHFNTRQYNHIVWMKPDELQKKLESRIAAIVGDGPHKKAV